MVQGPVHEGTCGGTLARGRQPRAGWHGSRAYDRGDRMSESGPRHFGESHHPAASRRGTPFLRSTHGVAAWLSIENWMPIETQILAPLFADPVSDEPPQQESTAPDDSGPARTAHSVPGACGPTSSVGRRPSPGAYSRLDAPAIHPRGLTTFSSRPADRPWQKLCSNAQAVQCPILRASVHPAGTPGSFHPRMYRGRAKSIPACDQDSPSRASLRRIQNANGPGIRGGNYPGGSRGIPHAHARMCAYLPSVRHGAGAIANPGGMLRKSISVYHCNSVSRQHTRDGSAIGGVPGELRSSLGNP
jgi:hypothetical protein